MAGGSEVFVTVEPEPKLVIQGWEGWAQRASLEVAHVFGRPESFQVEISSLLGKK